MSTNSTYVVEKEADSSVTEQLKTGWTSFLPLILIFVVFYFFLIRPQEKKRKQQQQMLNSLKKGENVITNSGIIGKVSKIDDSNAEVIIEVSPNVEIKMLKTSIIDFPDRRKQNDSKK